MLFTATLRLSLLVWLQLLTGWTVASEAGQRPVSGSAAAPPLLAEIQRIAALAGAPDIVSAAGITRSDDVLHTIESGDTFRDGAQRRLVIVGSLNGDERGAQAVVSALAWFKTEAPASIRRAWAVSAMPLADPKLQARSQTYRFPPLDGFFDATDQPESRYTWRWASFQAPDLVLEVWGGDSMAWYADDVPALTATALPRDSLASALSRGTDTQAGGVRGVVVTARASDGPEILRRVLQTAAELPRSALRAGFLARVARPPLEIARVLAARYPGNAIVSYIPSVAWTNTLRLASVTGDASMRQRVRLQTRPWIAGEQPLFGERITLTTAAGAMVYADLAVQGELSARALAIQGAEAVAAEKPDGIAQYGQGWTDDMFMSAAILARTGSMPGRAEDLDRLANRLVAYAGRLQREDGIFVHFTTGRQAWGRGNGFAALGLMEALTALPSRHPQRGRLLAIYRRHMSGLVRLQAPDGMWRQVVDQPGSYREASVTAMVASAMARGIRLGWLDRTYRPVVQRAWLALAAHITDDGLITDVCTSTGAGPTERYYLDRAAISGADDRGGAMALLAAMELHALGR